MNIFTFIKRAKDINDVILGDRATMLGVMLSPLIPSIVSGLYMKKLVSNPTNNPTNKALIEGLKDIIEKDKDIFHWRDTDFTSPPFSTVSATSDGEFFKRITPNSYKDPAVLAHEYGHTQNKMFNKVLEASRKNKKLTKTPGYMLYGIGKFVPSLASISSIFTNDENTSLITNSLGSAATVPMLWEELTASHKGSKALQEAAKMKNIKLTTLQRLKPYIGVPTYAALAAIPLTTHFGRKWSIGF